ncbi:hypothetical protein [Rhodoplanes serenus]|uniref:hypothetical protein n=1 Tax=Rhodoplanes serenus TaxID=200615 RepID=UPI0011B94008|nr:hypothetical protein [Rhodoplanes serenus]
MRQVPVAIWGDAGALWCKVEGSVYGGDRVALAWQRINLPITEEVYRAVAERGEPWPDIDPTVADQIRAGIGGNQPPQDEAEILREQIDAARAGIAEYASIGDDEACNRAQSLRARLLELGSKADKIREREKRPHFDAAKAVDARFMPLVKDAKDGADRLRRVMEAYMTAKAKREAEERRIAEQARLAEEAKRRASEPGPVQPPAPELPPPAARASAPIRGAYGRAASIKPVIVITDVTDWPALLAYYSDHPEVRALVRRLADRAVAAGEAVPGVATEEQRKIA